jgi:hypothetical protein
MIGCVRRLFVLVAIVFIVSPPSAKAQVCPPNAHVDRVDVSGNVETTHCKCNRGYENRGGQCLRTNALQQQNKTTLTVSSDVYATALDDCLRLTNVRELLSKKIAQLQMWRSDTRRLQQEFEALRADAARGVFSDALDVIPAEGIAKKIAATEGAVPKFIAGFEALQGVVSETEGIFEPVDSERLKKFAEGELSIRKGLLEIPLAHESESTKQWLGNLGNIYGSGVKLLAYAHAWRNGEVHPLSLQSLPETAKLAGEITALYYPPAQVPLGVTKLAVRAAQATTAQMAINNFETVLAQNWNAEQHLQDKIRQLNSSIASEDHTIESYRSTHAGAASCGPH